MPLSNVIEIGNMVVYAGPAGVNNGDVVIQTGDMSRYDAFMLMSTAGAMQVFASLDSTNFATAPLSLIDCGATTTAPVTVTAAGRIYAFFGTFGLLLVKQNGAPAVVNPVMTASKKGGAR